MGLIKIEGIKLFAYHGHLPEEAVLGGHFIVNVYVNSDTSEVEKSDDLEDTVDYVKLINIVEKNFILSSICLNYNSSRYLAKEYRNM